MQAIDPVVRVLAGRPFLSSFGTHGQELPGITGVAFVHRALMSQRVLELSSAHPACAQPVGFVVGLLPGYAPTNRLTKCVRVHRCTYCSGADQWHVRMFTGTC